MRKSRRTRPSWTRPTTAGLPVRNRPASSASLTPLAVTATTAVGSATSGSDPPPTNATSSNTSAATPGSARTRPANASARCRNSASGVASIRSTGISRNARAGSRYKSSVAARAASVILSGRKARISGSRSTRATSAAVPAMIPACGPPSNLSPLNSTTSAPAAMPAATSGSPGKPNGARSITCPLPTSSITGRSCFLPRATRSGRATAFVNPRTRKLLAWTRIRAAVCGPMARS